MFSFNDISLTKKNEINFYYINFFITFILFNSVFLLITWFFHKFLIFFFLYLKKNIFFFYYIKKIYFYSHYLLISFSSTIIGSLYLYFLFYLNQFITFLILNEFFISFLNNFFIYISIILIQLFLLILSIWTRACGPRVRIDQLSYLTWKEFLLNLFFIIIFLLFVLIFI